MIGLWRVLGEVFIQVMVFSTGLLVLAVIATGIYMRLSGRDPFTGRAMPQPRSTFQLRYSLFTSLCLFTSFLGRLVPKEPVLWQVALLGASILFMFAAVFFFIRFLRSASR